MKILKYILLLIGVVFYKTSEAQFTLQASMGHANYQWYKVDAAGPLQVVGGTSDTLYVASPGIYYATFDGTDCGKNASEYFVLTANNDSSLVLKAQQQSAQYQWFQNNTPIAGANADSLAVNSTNTLQYYNAQSTHAGCTKDLPGFYVYHLGIWAPLPLELVSFSATVDGVFARLDWRTSSEINTNYFVIERSKNLSDWQFVAQKNAAGNSVTDLFYQDFDKQPMKGVSYYRLKIVDLDNSFTYSEVRKIHIKDGTDNYVRLYPNPFTNQIIIEAPENEFELFQLYNAVGQLIIDIKPTEQNSRSNRKVMDVSELAEGVYFVKTKNTYTKLVKKN